ncbi:MAG: right-handed parallel beta-helix repeat-containing protein [Clostridia bacterium]|nr:right-handed parallel beta-helix repeat-containing protein [Clostridia bacterium]
MKNIIVTEQMMGDNATPILEKIISDAPDGATITFEAGTYNLATTVMIEGKKDLTLQGNGATLAPYFTRETGAEDGAGVFELLNCKNLVIRGFEVASTVPANTAGVIVNSTEDYVDVRLNTDTPFTGKELIIDGMIFEGDWWPKGYHWAEAQFDPKQRTVIAGEIPCSAPKKLNCPHEMLDEKTVRVYTKEYKWQQYSASVKNLKPGMLCNVSHTYYGLVAFVFRQCDTVLIEDVTMSNYAGFGFLILPHCHDFTFRRLKTMPTDRSRQPFALNSDGIHLTGLSGQLVLEDCEMDCIGDDRLNVHTQVMTVASLCENKMNIIYDKINGRISPYWSEAGDRLRIYNPETLEFKGTVTIVSSDCGDITLAPNDVDIKVGDYITNDKYYPDVTIRNCVFSHNRGRQLCLQGSNKVLIEDCKFITAASCSLYLSSAFDYWMEAGPLANVTIRNNLFHDLTGEIISERSTILVQINGARHQNIPPVHKNFLIENNRFENICVPPIIVKLTDGVTIRNNQFINCNKEFDNVRFENCTNVVCENNTVIE